jgi:hypothetical protein
MPDNRIQELCQRVVATIDPAEVDPILADLRRALQEHIAHMRSETAKELPLFFPQNDAA